MSTRRSHRHRSLAAVVLMSTTLIAGCSAAAEVSPPPAGAAANAAGAPTRVEADVRFSQEMITHHWQTIQLAELAADRSTDTYVRELAEKIKKGESADIELMSGWLRSWKVEVPARNDDALHEMPGMLSATQISSLRRRSGADFDKLWLSVLGKHLGSGVQMAQIVVALGQHGPTGDLAKKMVDDQSAQISEITERLA
ncbi:Uncharacterized conserved protein, DUF305 family [Streptosporangium subroseum]|uniref:Uncharacterized conserved protein, DUF305 family n=2 Tax=Streptosporangium subroseum TaxID=106412 RepID=A0A239E8P5_9ACTN|nr:Uncharacterized conserved protein, DUF305 family [Streptosporangium subroseum]